MTTPLFTVRSLVALGSLALALAAGQAAVGQDAVLSELYGSGVHRYFSGDSDRAIVDLTAAADGGSRDPRVYYFRALAKQRTGQDATADFQRGAALEAADTDQYYPVGKSLERVQGASRLQIERYRALARAAAFDAQRRRDTVRYQQRVQNEGRVLRQPPVSAGPAGAAPASAVEPVAPKTRLPAPAVAPPASKPAAAPPAAERKVPPPPMPNPPADDPFADSAAPAAKAPAAKDEPADELPAAEEMPAEEALPEDLPAADAPADDMPADEPAADAEDPFADPPTKEAAPEPQPPTPEPPAANPPDAKPAEPADDPFADEKP